MAGKKGVSRTCGSAVAKPAMKPHPVRAKSLEVETKPREAEAKGGDADGR